MRALENTDRRRARTGCRAARTRQRYPDDVIGRTIIAEVDGDRGGGIVHLRSSVARAPPRPLYGTRYASAAAWMPDDLDNFDPFRTLEEYAAHLNEICRPQLLGAPFYELMSGALVWTDETRHIFRRTPVTVTWALRPLWAFRTSLMLGNPREELAEYWRFGLAHFPRWVGFRPARRQATPTLLEIYRRGDVSLRKCLRDMEREEGNA